MKRASTAIIALICVCVFSFYGCAEENVTDWREFMDETTIVVCVDKLLPDDSWPADIKELLSEDTMPLDEMTELLKNSLAGKAKRIVHIDGVNETADPLFAIKLKKYSAERSDEILEEIRKLDFVGGAWRNLYDYKADIRPCEEKKIETINADCDYFEGIVVVTVDKSFADKLFTVTDFKIDGIVSVKWINTDEYENFTEGAQGTYRPQYRIDISDKSKQAVIFAVNALSELAFVYSASPSYKLCDDRGTVGYLFEI